MSDRPRRASRGTPPAGPGDEPSAPTPDGAGAPDGRDDAARAGREALIEELRADGASEEEIDGALRAHRLALLPVQRVLRGAPTLRTAELAGRTGIDPELLERVLQAAGIALPDHGAPSWQERDRALPALASALAASGMDDDAVVALFRGLGESAARVGAAVLIELGSGLTRPGDTEHDLAHRLTAATQHVDEHLADAIGFLVRTHVIGQLDAVELPDELIGDGRIAGATPQSVAFADVVGFTRMGEQLGAQRLHDVAARLGELGAEVATDGVRVVKTIGDAVMLAGARPGPVVAAMLALQERVAAEGFPRIRAGVATGDAVPRAGDWFGPPVNRAARACAAARPETVLTDDDTRGRIDDDTLDWTTIGRLHLKGMGRVRLHRVRRRAED